MKALYPLVLLAVGCLPQQAWNPSQACAERVVRFSPDPLPVETLPALTQACQAHDQRSCSVLGVLYETGRLTPANKVYAGYLFGWACQHGNQQGCSNFRQLTGLK